MELADEPLDRPAHPLQYFDHQRPGERGHRELLEGSPGVDEPTPVDNISDHMVEVLAAARAKFQALRDTVSLSDMENEIDRMFAPLGDVPETPG